MSDRNIDFAIDGLDFWAKRLSTLNKGGKFDNDSVIGLIKGWTKIVLWIKGSGSGFHKTITGQYVMHRDPTSKAKSYAQVLLNNVYDFKTVLERDREKQDEGDFYKRVRDGMIDFVWDYWKHLSGKLDKDFMHKLQAWQSKTEDDVRAEKLFPFEQ